MVCDDVKRIAYFFLDGKLGKNRNDDFQSHLHECADCDYRIIVHKRIRVFLKKRLGSKLAPERLRAKIRTAFTNFRSNLSQSQ